MTELALVGIVHQDVVEADYSGLVLDQFSTVGSTFTRCRFDKAKIKQAAFGSGKEQSKYVECSFAGTYLAALGGFTRFEGCTFHNLRVTKSVPDYLEFVDCVFTGRITGLRVWGAAPSLAGEGLRGHNEITGNDFHAAQLVNVEFRYGVDLTAQKLPAGEGYLYLPEAETAMVRALAALETDRSDEADEARTFIRSRLNHTVATGQKQLLFRSKDYERGGVVPAHVALALQTLDQS